MQRQKIEDRRRYSKDERRRDKGKSKEEEYGCYVCGKHGHYAKDLLQSKRTSHEKKTKKKRLITTWSDEDESEHEVTNLCFMASSHRSESKAYTSGDENEVNYFSYDELFSLYSQLNHDFEELVKKNKKLHRKNDASKMHVDELLAKIDELQKIRIDHDVCIEKVKVLENENDKLGKGFSSSYEKVSTGNENFEKNAF